MLRDTVSKFSAQNLAPLVAEMDREAVLNKGLLNDLFANGLMGVETPEE